MAAEYARAWLYFDPQVCEVIVYSDDVPDLSGKPLRWVWEQGWRLKTYFEDQHVMLVRSRQEESEASC